MPKTIENKIVRYVWRTGSSHGIPADKAYQELESIRARHEGKITAENVYEAAKHKTSVLHNYVFGPSNEDLILEARLQRCRSLINGILVEVVMEDNVVDSRRVFLYVDEDEGSYQETTTILRNYDKTKAGALTALKRARSEIAPYSSVPYCRHAFEVLQQTIEKIS